MSNTHGLDLNNIVNRVNADLLNYGVGDPKAWQLVNGNWLYVPKYSFLPDYKIPEMFKNNFEKFRKEIDPNPDNWYQSKETGQWIHDKEGSPSVQEKRRIERQRFQESEERRLREGEDEIRSIESYHSETSQPSDIPGMLTPKMPNLDELPNNEYINDLIKKIRRSYKKLKREYPSRPMGDRLRGLPWRELENFKNLVFELNYQRRLIAETRLDTREFVYPRTRFTGPLTSITPFSVMRSGLGNDPRTRINLTDEPGYIENQARIRQIDDVWNGYITREHARELREIENARGLNRIPATIRYWFLHNKITWRLYTQDHSIVDRLTERIIFALREGRNFTQEVRQFLLQQGIPGEIIESLLQSLSLLILELINLPRNILQLPFTILQYLKRTITEYLETSRVRQVSEPEPEREQVIKSSFRRVGGNKRKKKSNRTKKK